MTAFTPGELLALYAILTTSRAPGAPALAEKVHHEYQNAPRAWVPTQWGYERGNA